MSNIATIKKEFTELIRQAQSTKEKGWSFKINNYRKVISILSSLENTGTDISNTEDALSTLRDGGMGFKGEKPPKWKSKILIKIEEILQNGYLEKAEESRNDPKSQAISILMNIPEIGPSKAEDLYNSGITTLQQLLDNPDLVNRKQQIGLRYYKDLQLRIPRDEMDRWKEALTYLTQETLEELAVNSILMELVGSYRREHETSGDVDFYIAIKNGEDIDDIMCQLKDSLIETGALLEDDVFSCGPHKLMCVARLSPKEKARHLDIFIFHEHQYPFALMYATGSGEFNIRFRNHALQTGWSLSDKAICEGEAGGPLPSTKLLKEKIGKSKITSEQDIFTFLGLEYIQPKDRTPNVIFKLIENMTD